MNAREYPWAIEELAAAIAIFSHANVRSSKGGRALREAMLALLEPNELTQETIQHLELDLYDEEGNLCSLAELIGQLRMAGPAHHDFWRLFGVEAGSTMSQLLSYGPATLQNLTARIPESEHYEQLLDDTRRLVGEPFG